MRLRAQLQLLAVAIVVIAMAAVHASIDTLSWSDLFLPSLIATLLSLGLATLMARELGGHLRNLRDVTRSLAQGDLSARPPLAAPGEIGDLATAVHRLSEHLGSRINALKAEDALLAALIESLDEGVVAIDERRQVVRMNRAARSILGLTRSLPFPTDMLPRIPQLQRALDAAVAGTETEPAEAMIGLNTVSLTARPLPKGGVVIALFDLTRIRRLEAVRRDFVANVSHELRTPLTVISGFSETLADDNLAPDIRRQFAQTIHSHTERMQRIVDDLLDLSRLESGRWEASVAELNVRDIAEEISAIYGDAATVKGLTLTLDLDPAAERFFGDRTAVRQVLSNLADNAVRHTDTGSVTIFSRSAPKGVWIGVSDTGPGIRAEHLPRIFERFYRVDSARGRHTGGTGLGLAIVKHLVEAHNGQVAAVSEPGNGTTISAFFPEGRD